MIYFIAMLQNVQHETEDQIEMLIYGCTNIRVKNKPKKII